MKADTKMYHSMSFTLAQKVVSHIEMLTFRVQHEYLVLRNNMNAI